MKRHLKPLKALTLCTRQTQWTIVKGLAMKKEEVEIKEEQEEEEENLIDERQNN